MAPTVTNLPSFESTRQRRGLSLFTLFYVGLIVYGSLYPFSGWSPARGDILEFLLPSRRVHHSLGDLLTNVLAYIPLGLLVAYRGQRQHSHKNQVARAILVGAALSFSIEFVQQFLPSRDSSGVDLVANTLGTLIGALLSRYAGDDAPTRAMLVRWRNQWFVRGTIADLGLFALAAWTMSRLMPVVPSLDVGKLRAALAPLARVVADPRSFSGWLFLAESMMFAGMGFIACSLVRRGRSALATYFVLAAAIVVGQLPIVARQLTAEMLLGSAAGLVATALFCRWPTSVRASVAFFLCFSSFCITESVTTHAGGATYPFNWIPFAVNLDNTLGGIESLLELVSLSAALAWCVRTGATEPRTRWSGWTAGSLIAIGTLALELNQRKISGRIGDITTPLVMTIAWIVSLRFATTADPGRAENNDTALTPPRFAMRTAVGTTTPKVPYWVLSWALVAGVIWAVGQLPAVPYNVRELLYRDHPIRSAVMLAFALALTLGVPAWLIVWTTRRPWIWMLAPATLVANALVAWWVVVNAVASRNIHDIVGSPVLGWPGETETGLRFVALHGTIAFLVSWAVLVAMIAYRRSTMALVARWFVLTMPLAWISHWTIVERAATDNLTELMRDGGSLTASVLLSLAAVLSFLAGSLIAGSIANGRKRGVALALAVASSVGAFVLLNAGTEPALLKYGKVFSALQFLLSPDRAHYVGQGELIARYALAQLLLVGAVVLLQLPAWFAVAGHLPRPDGTAEQLDTRARTEQQP